MNETMTGGCQCGRVRYSVVVRDDTAELCHCGMCKRATGGVAAALKPVKRADLTWTAAAPDLYRSSPIAERPFCAACGSPLGFRYLDSEEMELTVGSFDDPSRFRPISHFAVETALSAWMDVSHLPAKRLADNARLVERWKKATGRLPD
jgi:hypothetical protein